MNRALLALSGHNLRLYADMRAIDPTIERTLEHVGEELEHFEPSLFEEWRAEGLWP